MTCCQFLLEPSLVRPATSCSLMVMIRSAMPLTSPSLQTNIDTSSIHDVLPVPAGALLGQAGHQLLPHGDDTVSHALNIPKPANKHRYIINT